MYDKIGMTTFAQQNSTKIDAVEQGGGALLSPLLESSLAGSNSLKKSQERHSVLLHKGMEKSILDDIMGDPEDFRALGDSDGESEGDLPSQCGLNAAAAVEKETIPGDNSQSQDFIKNAQSISLGKDNTHLSPREKKVNGGCFSSERQFCKEMESNCIKHVEANGGQRTSEQAGGTRYFIIKSLNHHNLEKSVKKGIWATQAMNEPILNEAFENSERVLLIFSVNMSGHFQGYAQMMSSIGQRRQARVWNETNWGGTFNVEWIRLYDLPFQRTIHLKNPLNFFKPVKISRDCQELPEEIGEALCALIDEGADGEGRTKRRSAHFGDGFSKKAFTERVPWGNSDLYGRAGTMPIESPWALMYPYGFPSSFSNNLYNAQVPVTMGGFSAQASIANSTSIRQHRVSRSSSLVSGSPRKDVGGCQERRGKREQLEGRERPLLSEHKNEASRVDGGPGAAGVPIDDDFLNMTYEEYLQRVGDASDHAHHQQGVSIWNSVDEYC